MKKQFTFILAVMLMLFAILLISLTSCYYSDHVLSYSDLYNHHVNSQDTIVPPIDTITAPIECEEFIHLSDTNFVCLSASFDLPLSGVTWNWYEDLGANPYNSLLELLQDKYGSYTYTIYQTDNAVAVFIDGTNNTIQFSGKIIAIDLNNSRTTLTAYKNGFYHWGACTYEEALYEANHRLNIESFSFTYTNYTPEQNNTLARAICHFDLCKAGERIANYVGANGTILPSVIDSTNLYGWNNVYQIFNPDLLKA